MLNRLMQYGSRDRGPDTAILTVALLILMVFLITETGSLENSQTQEQVATSELVPDFILVSFRIACSIVVLITLTWIAIDKKGSTDYPLNFKERENLPRKVVGPTRLAAFTMCHFALIGVSFGFSGASSLIHISGGTVPKWILIASPILFSTSYSCAILVTFIVTFRLIPSNLNKGLPIRNFFSWYEILMHNGNIVMLGTSLFLNGMDVQWQYFAYPVLFGIAYVAWAAVYANYISGVFIYDFLDYRMKGAPLIYIGLLTIIVLSFVVVLTLDRLADWSIVSAVILTLLMTWGISTIREPVHG